MLRTRHTSLKHVWFLSLVALAFMLPLLMQHQSQAEAKIAKKVLKKAKKYAWLLAPQRQKFYAIPFPFPLPVFVKRQHIYTQVPVIPRYVQQPSYGSSSDYGSASAPSDNYASMSSSMPDISSYLSSSSASSKEHPKQTSSSKYSRHKIGSSMLKSGGYLAQFASAMGHNYNPTSVGSRDLLTKLVTGQAKIISPAALLSNLKPGSSAGQSTSGPLSSAEFDENYQQNVKDHSDEAGSAGAGSDSNGKGSSSKSNSEQSSSNGGDGVSGSLKQSASETFYSAPRYPMRAMQQHPYQHLVHPAYARYASRLHPSMMQVPPYAPFAAAHRIHMPIYGGAGMGSDYSSMAAATNELLPMVEPMAESSDVMEAQTSAASGQRALLAEAAEQRQLQKVAPPSESGDVQLDALRKRAEQEQLVEAMQRIRYKAALVAAHERQVAEANAAALAGGQLRLVGY